MAHRTSAERSPTVEDDLALPTPGTVLSHGGVRDDLGAACVQNDPFRTLPHTPQRLGSMLALSVEWSYIRAAVMEVCFMAYSGPSRGGPLCCSRVGPVRQTY